jgi:hypothetical protein
MIQPCKRVQMGARHVLMMHSSLDVGAGTLDKGGITLSNFGGAGDVC